MPDSLTPIYDQHQFLELARQELMRSARCNRPVTLVIIDIDHFKTINDTYGHPGGDAVLRDIARCLRGNLRQSDLLARFSREAFCLMMPETDQSQALAGAERLRRLVAATPVSCGSEALSVTVSMGLSCWPAHSVPSAEATLTPPHINDLIGKAGRALYRAQHSGHNQTQVEAWICSVGQLT